MSRGSVVRMVGLALFAVCVSAASGCGSWRDALGRAVDLPFPAASVASLAPNVTEILYAIGAQERVAGVSNQCDFPLAAKLKPKAGSFNHPDLEKIKALRPAVVLFSEYARREDLDALERIGVKAVVLSFRDLADLAKTIRLLGRITGQEEQAHAAAAALERSVAEVSRKLEATPPARRPRVYIEVDGPNPIYAVGSGSFMGDVIRVAGGRNVFEVGPGPYNKITDEDVIRANPDVALIDHPFQYKVGVMKRAGWAAVSAVKNGKVYDGADFDVVLLNRASPRVAQSLWEIARLLHPEVFTTP